jgi:MtN3 and saliva related transmembrane protein
MVSTALGIAAATWALVMALAPLLQIREIVRRRSSEGISVAYLAVLLVGFALWTFYGVARQDAPLIIPNSVAFVVMAITIAVARRAEQPRRPPPATRPRRTGLAPAGRYAAPASS